MAYILIDRDVLDLLTQKPTQWAALYLQIKARVNWADGKPWPGFAKGSTMINLRKMEVEIGVPATVSRRALDWMESAKLLETRQTWRGIIVTIIETTLTEDKPKDRPVNLLDDLILAWEGHCGGELEDTRDKQRLLRALKKHGDDTTIKAFNAYLGRTAPKYCSIAHFCATLKSWLRPEPTPDQPGSRPVTATKNSGTQIINKEKALQRMDAELGILRQRRWDEDAKTRYPAKYRRMLELMKSVEDLKNELERLATT